MRAISFRLRLGKKEQVPIKHANWIYRKQMSILVIKQCNKFFFLRIWETTRNKKRHRERESKTHAKCQFCSNIYTLSDHFLRVFNHFIRLSYFFFYFYSISNQWRKQKITPNSMKLTIFSLLWIVGGHPHTHIQNNKYRNFPEQIKQQSIKNLKWKNKIICNNFSEKNLSNEF